MKIKIFILFLCVLMIVSCFLQKENLLIHEPDYSIYDLNRIPHFGNIIETQKGTSSAPVASAAHAALSPEWFASYVSGGIDEVEKLDSFNNKYAFIAHLEGENLPILEKWKNNFVVLYDFPMLASARIERRMLLTAHLFPDDEYGSFYEIMVKYAINAEYPQALKEDTVWFRAIKDINGEPKTVYVYLILITIDKNSMQSIIKDIMTRAVSSAAVTRTQNNSINRLRQNFFEGF